MWLLLAPSIKWNSRFYFYLQQKKKKKKKGKQSIIARWIWEEEYPGGDQEMQEK